jgi:replicative DNA helicase
METVILKNLVLNEDYARKVVPFLQEEYFQDKSEKAVFNIVSKFILKYNNIPTKDAILISLGDEKTLGESEFKKCTSIADEMYKEVEKSDTQWLIENTEKFCKEKAIYNGIMESIGIIEGKDKVKTQNSIPEIMTKALSVSFDTKVGHDFLEDTDARYDYYHRVEEKVPFDLEMFNLVTRGGTRKKTLNVVMAASGVGKSAFLCHHAAACLSQNLNVLYITLEMAEEEIAKRIDANLLNTDMHSLENLPHAQYESKIDHLKNTCRGKLIIKEYPTAAANVTHFRTLLEELKIKKKFVPDVIFVDYLNICSCARFKLGNGMNSYTYVKGIAEELRGLAKQFNIPLWTATQVNREGAKSSDMEMTDTSESFGLPQTADFFIALIETDELAEAGQLMVKQLKNRGNDTTKNRKFLVGVDKSKMKFYDVDNTNNNLVNSNNTDEEAYGSGSDVKTFDTRFGRKKTKAVNWSFEDAGK